MQPAVIEERPEPLPPLNALQVIQAAIDKGITGEQLESFVRTIERLEDRRAAQRFAEAITAFQAECPQIEKLKKGDKGMYAPYEHLMLVARPIMVKYGLCDTYTFDQVEGGVKCTCRVRVGSHMEPTTVTVRTPQSPMTSSGKAVVNDTQLDGQAMSYAKRYAVCPALGIVVKDEDKDAMDLTNTIDEAEQQQLRHMIADKGGSEELFLDYASKQAGSEVKSFESIPVAIFPKLLDGLKRVTPKPGSPAALRAAKNGGK